MQISPARDVTPLVVAPLLAFVSFGLLHWKGIGLNPDGWAMWQGAASLTSGHGYSYFSGQTIVWWPPLYALYLAAWMLLLGPTGWSLIAANGVVIALQALLWTRFARTVARTSSVEPGTGAYLLLSVFLGLFVALQQKDAMAQHLLYALLPLFLSALWRLLEQRETPGTPPALWTTAAFGSLLMLTHNAALIFVAAGALIVAAWPPRSARAVGLATVITVVPALVWLIVRLGLGQSGSHPVGLGTGRFGPVTYLVQLFDGPGRLLAPTVFGAQFVAIVLLIILVAALARGSKTDGLRFGFAFVVLSALGIYLLFNVTWVFNRLSSENYILFIPLVLVPLAVVFASARWPRLTCGALLAMLLPQFYWSAIWMQRQHLDLEALGFSRDFEASGFVPPRAYIQRDYRSGPPIETPAGLLVAPISFDGRCDTQTSRCR